MTAPSHSALDPALRPGKLPAMQKSTPPPGPPAAHTHPWKISDVVIFPLLALGFVAEWLWPTGFGLWRPAGVVLGLGLFLGGFRMIARAKAAFQANDQPSLPGTPTTRLVTSGPYRYSRNPNYLGTVIAGIGGAIGLDMVWILASTLLSAVLLDIWMIRPEERYLRTTFGADYEAYAKQVRRWI
ncbi:MAG: methyltransferase family protein [Marinibacterium sp.]